MGLVAEFFGDSLRAYCLIVCEGYNIIVLLIMRELVVNNIFFYDTSYMFFSEIYVLV